MLKVIVPFVHTPLIASRKEPAPLSLVLVTTTDAEHVPTFCEIVFDVLVLNRLELSSPL